MAKIQSSKVENVPNSPNLTVTLEAPNYVLREDGVLLYNCQGRRKKDKKMLEGGINLNSPLQWLKDKSYNLSRLIWMNRLGSDSTAWDRVQPPGNPGEPDEPSTQRFKTGF